MRLFLILTFIICLLVSVLSTAYSQRNPYDWGLDGVARNMNELSNQLSREKAQQEQMKLERERLQLERERMQMERERMQSEQRNQNVRFWIEKGDTHIRSKNYGEALSSFETAISLNSDYAVAWSGKAFSLYQLKRYDEALYAINRSLQLRPDNESDKKGREIILNKLIEKK